MMKTALLLSTVLETSAMLTGLPAGGAWRGPSAARPNLPILSVPGSAFLIRTVLVAALAQDVMGQPNQPPPPLFGHGQAASTQKINVMLYFDHHPQHLSTGVTSLLMLGMNPAPVGVMMQLFGLDPASHTIESVVFQGNEGAFEDIMKMVNQVALTSPDGAMLNNPQSTVIINVAADGAGIAADVAAGLRRSPTHESGTAGGMPSQPAGGGGMSGGAAAAGDPIPGVTYSAARDIAAWLERHAPGSSGGFSGMFGGLSPPTTATRPAPAWLAPASLMSL